MSELPTPDKERLRPRVQPSWIDLAAFAIYLAFFGLGIAAAQPGILSRIALSLSAVCTVLWVVARWQLGSAFAVGPDAQTLVTRGLYSKIRHPVYVFGTLAFLFVVLALQGWFALVIWVAVIAIQVRRARLEERVLLEKFGEQYTTYRNKTWF
jgi:protein-S-isoprenylcysteine O-methyltransferase Ste14